jgi:pectinesterase
MALQQGQEVAAVDAVVAKDGSGDFTTITSAVDAAPQNSMSRHVIRVAKGV